MPSGNPIAPNLGQMSTSDIIFPLHEFDDSPINRYMQHWTLRFDAALETKKLCVALTHLLNLGDWRKLGGRLQFNKLGKLEIHAPRAYSNERPAFQFSEEAFLVKTADHPVAKNLPRARGKPELFPGITSQFNSLTLGPEWALDFTEHTRRREPIIGVHIALFHDATLISIRWAHVVCDFMGIKALVLAWSMDLDGRYDDIPPFMGAYDDPLRNVGTVPPKEPYALADMQLNPEAFKKTYETYLEHVARYPTSVRRMLVLPDSALQTIKMDFTSDHTSDKLEVIPKGALFNGQFVSDADILAAWAARLCCGILPSVDRPVHVMGMYEARHCLPEKFPQRKDKPDSSPVFIANATFSTSTNTTLRALRQQPLARTALSVRESVATLTRAPQVHAQLHLLRESYAKDKENPPVFAAQDAFILVVSNFSKMSFFDSIDFSPAVIAPAAVCHGKSPGKLAWHQWTSLEHNTHIRNMFQVGGKDGQGNTWMMAILPPETWAVVEEHLADLSGSRPNPPSKL
ncbi:lysr family regulatory [Fusarium pseudocircinatum]|uniref:Lysr family regulatory n=1 Tax=Fusarium pseudocircinatum TaxID=56676 RepID=A0A8H5KPT5_9HYPO|nr:lysr family regulatory [Fusarium pseudocircinatum]